MQILKEQMGPHRDICLGVAGHLEGMGESGNERGSVLSTAKTQTQWLDDPRMQQILSSSDFAMADLKQKTDNDLSVFAIDAYGDACAMAAAGYHAGAVGHGAHTGKFGIASGVRAG